MVITSIAGEEERWVYSFLRRLSQTQCSHQERLISPPRIDDALDRLGKVRIFSSLDLNSGYWQVEINEEDRKKTAFATEDSLFQWFPG